MISHEENNHYCLITNCNALMKKTHQTHINRILLFQMSTLLHEERNTVKA